MSSLLGVWSQVRKKAIESGMPDKPRAILREYLQLKAIDFLYSQRQSQKLAFIGGTSLRLLYDIPRFSEDLDFDNLGVSDEGVIKMIKKVVDRFEAENIPIELFQKITEGKTYFELRFPDLLKELQISTNPREKLMIKVDYARQWRGQVSHVVLIKRMGIVQSVGTNQLDQILVEKLAAYAGRKTVQPRDMYDVVWLWGQGAKLDLQFMKTNGIEDLLIRAKKRSKNERVSQDSKRKLAPFLFNPQDEVKLDLFPEVLAKLSH